jgi:hypothetical protein
MKSIWIRFLLMGIVVMALALTTGVDSAIGQSAAKDQKFETYRKAILKEHGIDIKQYQEKLRGGRADGKDITRYELDELIMGIKVEREHTTDKYTALEIATDHLEEFPDYYTRLEDMEEKAEKDWKEKRKK